jgi:polysaccharide pyruvyl transferase WcaK-like protein
VLRASGTTRQIVPAADPAFRLGWGRAEEEQAAAVLARAGADPGGDRPLAAVVCRRLRSRHPYAAEHYEARSARRIDATVACFAAAVDRLVETGLTPLFVPMNTADPDDDREMARRVAGRARHGGAARFVEEALRPAVVPALLSGCRLLVTSRLHGAILAAVAGVPSSIHAIGPKLAGMAQVLGLEPWLLEEATATPEASAAAVSDLLERRQEVRVRLSRRVEELREEALVPGHLAAAALAAGRPATAGRRPGPTEDGR